MKFVPRSEATRDFIIKATAELFNKQGYAGTSITDLEKATKLTKGSIYGNFENKEQVAIAAFDYNLAMLRKKIRIAVDAATTAKGKLMAYLQFYNNPQMLGGGCPIQNTGVEADDTHEGLRQRAAEGIISFKGNVVQLLHKGVEAGEFRKDVDTEKVALTFIAMIEGAILISRTTQDHSALKTILESVHQYIEQICLP
ncbi:transcriptional regulator, TetR family [Pedobacter westerhofensis]|uniref:Transcriptional regulator, TetR family n=1 Tax=Pedobacter westerhofensis TaxID=425512 RepID=A0A521FG81_9SPHI|nr:TetR/AcrR family transcriptional regulator [Pedobacter westerhofensis]SMO95208.1 transcriptional regulator, TetR family [Pedobacter westerhofensis]